MKILVAPDKFKGSCSSAAAGKAVIDGLKQKIPEARTFFFPMSDGGDGFAAAYKYYHHTQTVKANCVDPLGRKMRAAYEWLPDEKIAVIELAAASGWALLKPNERDPLRTSTFGTGLLITHAINRGAKKILLGLGGSATSDGGMGIACALGFQCHDDDGRPLAPSGLNLMHIRKISSPRQLPKVRFDLCCDVVNPLYGKKGAAYIYGPQKGADEKGVLLLDNGLRNLAARIQKQTGVSVSAIKGMGAAGGAPCFLYAYFKCSMQQGAEWMIKESGILKSFGNADLLITGEGAIDEQSLQGKLVGQLNAHAAASKVPVLLLCGRMNASMKRSRKWKNIPVLELMQKARSQEEAIRRAVPLIKQSIVEYFSSWK